MREYQGTRTGAKAGELCCLSKTMCFFPDGAFALPLLLQHLTGLLQACECHLSAGLKSVLLKFRVLAQSAA